MNFWTKDSGTDTKFYAVLFAMLIIEALLNGCAATNQNAVCAVQFDYVRTFKSSLDVCRGINGPVGNVTSCCRAMLNNFGIGLGLNLKHTGNFEFSDNATAVACLNSYQVQVEQNGVTRNFLNTCFPHPYPDPSMFVSRDSLCSGIMTVDDWHAKVGHSNMDISCKGDLNDESKCFACTADTTSMVGILAKNATSSTESEQCIYFACLYGASIVNEYGPTNPGTAGCLLGANVSRHKAAKHKYVVFIGCIVSLILVFVPSLGISFYLLNRSRKRKVLQRKVTKIMSFMPNTGLIQFKYEEIKLATQNFNKKAIIGEGGFGTVYKGMLGTIEVAVKLLKNATADGDAEFLNEMEVINKVRHRNLVHLRGCCVHGTKDGHMRMLVYDFMPNGSLEDHLHGPTKSLLKWPERRKIALGMALGINYLHSEIQPAIIHRDIKPSNILLDSEFNARVADFGLAKVTPEGMTHMTTRVAGTPVYIAVEYALYGQLTEKIDVYSFGIVLLELMSGRKALDLSSENSRHFHIVDWAWNLAKEGNVKEIVDESIRESGPRSVMERFVLVGILCAHVVVGYRPSMGQALRMLEGDDEIPEIPDRPTSYICDGSFEGENSYNYNQSVVPLQSRYSVKLATSQMNAFGDANSEY